MKKIISLLLSLTSILCLFPTPARAFIPIPNENGEYEYDEDGNLVINSGFSLEGMKPFNHPGSINVEQEIINLLGYNPNREWSIGDRPEDVLTFGDLESYGFQSLTIKELNLDLDAGNVSLDRVGIIQDLSVRELVKTVPNLGDRLVGEVAPFRDTFPNYLQYFELRQVFNLNAEELSDEVRKRVQKEVRRYVEQKVSKNQELILTGIADGIDSITSSISEEITANFTESAPLDLEIINTATKAEIRQKMDKALERLESEVTEFLQENHEQTALEIEVFIGEKLDEYKAEIATIANTAFEDLKAAVSNEIVEQVGSIVEELDLDEFEQLFNAYKQLVGDFSDDIIGTVKEEVVEFARKELAKISNIIDEIPDDLGDLAIDNFELENYTVSDIPGLSDTAIERFKNYKTTTFSQVPGASNYSFDNLPSFNINFGTGVALVDLVFGEAEQFADRAISGSLNETFNFATCRRSQSLNGGCAHVELAGPLFFNRGKQWVSGDSQETDGGKNALKFYGGGKEPTGRLPFYGSKLKMVLRNNNEQTDTTELFLALQICVVDPSGTEHCTPHNVLEFPIYTFKTGDLIFLGITI